MLSKLLFGDAGGEMKPEHDSLINLTHHLSQMDRRHRKLREKIEAREVEKYLSLLGGATGKDSTRFEKLKKRIDSEF